MPNTVSGFYQTVVAAATEASQTLMYQCKAIESVYVDYSAEQAALGKTLNVVIPASRLAGVVDGGVADVVLVDVNETTVPIVFDKHPLDALVIRDFEQYNSPAVLRRVFMDSALKGVKEYINNLVCGLFVTGTFTTNTAIAATSGLISTTQFLAGQAVLADQKVDITDPSSMTLLVPSVPWTKLIGNATWTDAQVAGNTLATAAHMGGEFASAYGVRVKLDQQMPVSGTLTARTWTAALFHKYCVAVVTRPLPAPDAKVVDYMYVDFAGIPIRVTLGYNQYPKQGYILTVDAGCGVKVVRENLGQLFTVAE